MNNEPTWDPRGNIQQIGTGGASSATYTYTSDGWRTAKTSSAGATTYLYDGDMLLAECDSTGNTIQNAYIWGATGLNTRVSNPQSAPSVLGYAFDPSGNVVNRVQCDSSSPVLTSELFQAFGERIAAEGDTTEPIAYKGQSGCYTDTEISAPMTDKQVAEAIEQVFASYLDTIGFTSNIENH